VAGVDDGPARAHVALCVTDLAQGRLMAAAAKSASPRLSRCQEPPAGELRAVSQAVLRSK
jgi:hypothetical protein